MRTTGWCVPVTRGRAIELGWLPPRTNDITVAGSLLQFRAEIVISEPELRAWCQEKEYDLAPITDPVLVHPVKENGQYATIEDGFVYDRLSHRGGYRLVWDRTEQKAYVIHAHN
jgi:hypothetical protein